MQGLEVSKTNYHLTVENRVLVPSVQEQFYAYAVNLVFHSTIHETWNSVVYVNILHISRLHLNNALDFESVVKENSHATLDKKKNKLYRH